MELIVDANVVISALIADGTTRELIVTIVADLSTPSVIRDEVESHRDRVVERSGLPPDLVTTFMDLLFEFIEVVPTDEFSSRVDEAERAIGDVDPDDVLYLACALARDAAIWSDDSDFAEQDLVPVYSTADIVESFDTK